MFEIIHDVLPGLNSAHTVVAHRNEREVLVMKSSNRTSPLHLVLGIGLVCGGACYEGASSTDGGPTGGPGVDDSGPAAGIEHESVVRVPVGEDGVRYEGVEQEDALPWGPTAFAVGPDDTMWLADGPRLRLLVHDARTGERVDTLLLVDHVERIGALVVTAEAVHVLDTGARTRLVRIDRADGSTTVEELPNSLQRDRGVTGMQLASDGAVLVELHGGAELYQVVDHSGVTLQSLPAARRANFTDHKLRSKDDAEDLVLRAEQGRIS